MGSRKTTTMRGGILVPDMRLVNVSSMAANDGGANTSSFTEANPRPGSATTSDPYARLRPLITGGQGSDADIYVNQGGYPGREGLRALYRVDGDSDDDWRGWNHPITLTGFTVASWTTDATGHRYHDVAVIPSTQQPICVYRQQGASRTSCKLWSWTAPGSWGSEVDIISGGLGQAGTPAVLVLPGSERVVVWLWSSSNGKCFAHYSDDQGTTWAPYAANCFVRTTATWSALARMRAAYHPETGNIGIVVEEDSDTGDWSQFASSDLGVTFNEIGSGGSADRLNISLFSIPGTSAIGMVWRDFTTDLPKFSKIANPYEDLSAATIVAVDAATTLGDVAGYADHDGTIYIIGRDDSTGLEDAIRVWRSTDEGATWFEYQYTTTPPGTDANLVYSSGDNTTYPTNLVAVPAGGSCFLMHNWESSANTADKSLGCMLLGGWHNVVATHDLGATLTTRVAEELDEEMMGWGWETSSKGRTYLPYDLPDALTDWTTSGAGTGALETPGHLSVTTGAGQALIYEHASWSTPDNSVSYLIEVRRNSGDATNDVADVLIENGANDRHFTLKVTATGFEWYDEVAGGTLGSAITGLTMSDFHIIAVHYGLQGFECWYWKLGETKAVSYGTPGFGTGGAVGAASRFRFGIIAASTAAADFDFRQIHWRSRETSTNGCEARIDRSGVVNPGRPISLQPYPVPDLGTSTDFAFIAAEAGPGRLGDTWDVDAEHDHPIEHALPALHPSSRKVWRSVSNTEQRISFTLGSVAQDATRLGGSYTIGLALLNCRGFQTAQLRGYTTAGGWTTLGTLNLGHSVGFMDKIGDIVHEGVDASDGARFYRHGEFTWLVFDEGNDTFEIEQHNGGWLTTNTTAKPEFRIKAPTATSNGTAFEGNTLVSPSGVLVVHLAQGTTYERWQVRITASQDSPWSYYQIGAMLCGPIYVPGQQPSNGWSKQQRVNVRDSTTRSGERRVIKQGEPTWDWTWSWVDGLLHSRRGSDADYRGSSVGDALTGDQEVFTLLAGIVRQDLNGGEYPVVALEEVPDADGTTITAPDLWNYGHLDVDVGATQVQGDDAAPESVRVEKATVRGLP